MNRLIVILVLLVTNSAFAIEDTCDVSKTARQMVKSIVAIADIRGVTNYYGGSVGGIPGETIMRVEPHYTSFKDSYDITIRDNDCRVLQVKLVGENLPLKF